jgi:isoleucyl-tRNA synthetase
MMMACVRRLIWSLLASIVVSIGEGLGRIDQAVMRDIVVRMRGLGEVRAAPQHGQNDQEVKSSAHDVRLASANAQG